MVLFSDVCTVLFTYRLCYMHMFYTLHTAIINIKNSVRKHFYQSVPSISTNHKVVIFCHTNDDLILKLK